MHSAGSFPTPAITTNGHTTWRDGELVAAARAGSDAAFEDLRNLYSNRLYKRILSITRNHEDAEDALQDTFLRAFLAFGSFRGRSHVSTWLTRIAINSALLVIRRRGRARAEVSLTPCRSGAGFQEFDVRDSAPTPEENCDMKQRFDRMFRAIGQLDPASRHAIGIRIAQECSMEELARILDITVGAVKTRLHRARKKLARHLDHRVPQVVARKHREFELGIGRQHA